MRRSPLLATLLAASTAAALAPTTASAARSPRLPAFDTCSELVQFGRAAAPRPPVVVRALPGGDSIWPRAIRPQPKPRVPSPTPDVPPDAVPMPAVAPTAAPGAGGAIEDTTSAGADDFSGTNVQELGIDEPDLVKTDGKRLFVVIGAELWAYDVTGAAPKLLSKLSLEGAPGQILLRGDRILVLGRTSVKTTTPPPVGPMPAAAARAQAVTEPAVPAPPPNASVMPPPPAPPEVRLAEIDARNPSAMKIVRTMVVPGSVVSARLTKGTIRVILSSPAELPESTDTNFDGAADEPVAANAAKKLGVRSFVPRTTLHSRRTKRTFNRSLVACDDVRHPTRAAGSDLLTVLTVDFDEGLFNVDRDAVLAGAQVVYASAGSLYVASTRALDLGAPADVPRSMVSEIHRFDASQAGQTEYVGSGTVPGFALNQYSLSEDARGDLRVATTELPQWIPGAATVPSQSHVTVLRTDGRALKEIGRVSGLGRGERIYAVRFIDDRAYVVTFRQTDPLYTVDLSDPAAPKIAGELKINGYSAYLHPIGEHLLLGVGRDADDRGRTTGAQVSIFDTSNPAAPTRIANKVLGPGGFAAEFDPHAFLWWAPTSLALLPYSGWDPKTYARDAAVVGISATKATGLNETGRVTHGPEWDRGQIVRSVIAQGRVITVSELGIGTSALDGLGARDFQAFLPSS